MVVINILSTADVISLTVHIGIRSHRPCIIFAHHPSHTNRCNHGCKSSRKEDIEGKELTFHTNSYAKLSTAVRQSCSHEYHLVHDCHHQPRLRFHHGDKTSTTQDEQPPIQERRNSLHGELHPSLPSSQHFPVPGIHVSVPMEP